MLLYGDVQQDKWTGGKAEGHSRASIHVMPVDALPLSSM